MGRERHCSTPVPTANLVCWVQWPVTWAWSAVPGAARRKRLDIKDKPILWSRGDNDFFT